MQLVLGTMYFGTRTDEADSFALLDRFVAAGGRILDTANCYSFWMSATGHGGQSEALLGRWLAANPGLRDELVIATKVGVEPAADGGPKACPHRSSSASRRAACERLGLDTIDLYWAHGQDLHTELEETVAAFGGWSSRASYGGSGSPTTRPGGVERGRAIAAGLGVEPWTALQLTTSYVDPRPRAQVPGKDHRFGFVTDETVDYLEEHPEVDLWVYSPLVQGSFDRDDRPFPEAYDHPGTTSRLATLNAVAAERDVPASQVVLAWLVAQGWQPIVGVSTVEQLDSALASDRITFTPPELDVLC